LTLHRGELYEGPALFHDIYWYSMPAIYFQSWAIIPVNTPFRLQSLLRVFGNLISPHALAAVQNKRFQQQVPVELYPSPISKTSSKSLLGSHIMNWESSHPRCRQSYATSHPSIRTEPRKCGSYHSNSKSCHTPVLHQLPILYYYRKSSAVPPTFENK